MSLRSVIALCVLVALLAGCGSVRPGDGRALPVGVVVQIGANTTITAATVEHWARVEAVLAYERDPVGPVPAGVVPDPPRYSRCIAFQAKLAAEEAGRGGSRPDSVVALCSQEHRDLQAQAMRTLITSYWVRKEAAAAHVSVTARQIQASTRRQPWARRSTRDRRAAGVSTGDERFIVESELLLTRLQRTTLPIYEKLRRTPGPETAAMAEAVDRELNELNRRMAARWTPRTRCRRGFVIELCRR